MGEVRALKRSYVITRSQRAIRVEAIATFAVSESLPTMCHNGHLPLNDTLQMCRLLHGNGQTEGDHSPSRRRLVCWSPGLR